MPISFSSLSGGGGGKSKVTKEFLSTGSWTAPDDVTQVYVFACGGGGGGKGFGTNNFSPTGGYGSVDEKVLTVTPGQTYTVTIGAGGATSESTPAKGGTTSLGNIFSLEGGDGGANSLSNTQRSAGKGGTPGAIPNFTNQLEWHIPNSGLHGRGGGGGSGQSSRGYSGVDGGGQVGANVTYPGALNSGGGGAGSGNAGASSGGSGYLKLEYWTAE